jgi:hypothetical protein
MVSRLHLICVLALAAALSFGEGISAQHTNSPPQYQIYAIRYATIPDLPVAMFVKDAAPERKTAAAMAIWLIRGNGRNVLLDSGFYHERFFKDFNTKRFGQSPVWQGFSGRNRLNSHSTPRPPHPRAASF